MNIDNDAREMTVGALVEKHRDALDHLGAVTIIWLPEDVASLWDGDEDFAKDNGPRPTYTEAQEALADLARALRDESTRAGWGVLEALVPEAIEKVRNQEVVTPG